MVGWSVSATMAVWFVAGALTMVIGRRGKPGVVLRDSDQKCPYNIEKFQKLLADHDVACGVSETGNVWTSLR
jgi:putative transposase